MKSNNTIASIIILCINLIFASTLVSSTPNPKTPPTHPKTPPPPSKLPPSQMTPPPHLMTPPPMVPPSVQPSTPPPTITIAPPCPTTPPPMKNPSAPPSNPMTTPPIVSPSTPPPSPTATPPMISPSTPPPRYLTPPPKITPTTSPTCQIGRLSVCANVLNIVNVGIGQDTKPCCNLINGLIDLEASICLCAALKANILGIIIIDLNIPLQLILNRCGRQMPTNFKCSR
ncbi:lipid transfer protein EARLI 1-like [Vicia villosa]|uniref:lipid transfer protein EARLI 1-like n=1 Tax=Vicia villosa TaxID=3911 RepID=UPI00273BFCA5|nr:lipid transfer protein EARLI 1-like [Vicia villosa]